jgi:uncharacterized protein (TIGR02246 family)
MKQNTLLLAGLAGLILGPFNFASANEPAPESPAASVARAYVEAFNAGNADKLAAVHAKDAEWVDADGNAHAGREAIRTVLAKSFAAAPGRTIEFNVERFRPLADNVILENGSATVTSPDGERSVSAYTTVYTKDGDEWLIAQVTETAPDIDPSPASRLAALRWLEGKWRGENAQRPVTLEIAEAQNGSFLTIKYSFGDNGDEGTSTEVVGYDAAEDRIRSWTFDSAGGFSEALWQPDGANWLLVSKSVNPDGTRASSQLEMRPAADGRGFTVEGYNRESGGVPMPKLGPIKFTPIQ